MLNNCKSKTLTDICDLFDLNQIVTKPTCFKYDCKPSLVDVIVTNNSNLCFNTQNFSTGISDCHNLVCTVIKGKLPTTGNTKVQYRSFKDFDTLAFNNELMATDFPDTNICSEDMVNQVYNEYENTICNILNKHAPVKCRTRLKKPFPCMNRELRKAVYRKHMLYNRYIKYRTSNTWEMFRKQRNIVVKLKRKSVRNYFLERCAGGTKCNKFWQTIIPYLSKKGNSQSSQITLVENGNITSDQEQVGNCFNHFYANVATQIGQDVIYDKVSHSSINAI